MFSFRKIFYLNEK